MKTKRSLVALMLASVSVYSQSALPSKEYIRLGARVVAVEPPPLPATATLVPQSSTVSSGTQVFSSTVTAAAGNQSITYMQILIASAPGGGGQGFCYLHYDAHGNRLWLYSSDLGYFIGNVPPETTSATLNSSYCAVNTYNTHVLKVGTTLTISTEFLFKVAGARHGYVRVVTDSGYDSDWVQKDINGGYDISPAPLQLAMSVTPASWASSPATVTLYYPDPPGFGSPTVNLGSDQFLVAAAPDGGGQPFCFIHYDRAANQLYLYDRLTGLWSNPSNVGIGPNLSNTDCSISVASAYKLWANGTLALSFPLSLNTSMNGTKHKYMRSTDILGRDTGWQQRTSDWIISGTPPPTPEFELSNLTNGQINITQAHSQMLQVTGSNGFNSTVSFATAGLPSGTTSQFTPLTITGSGSTTVTITPSRLTPNTTAALTVTGSATINGTIVPHSKTMTLQVTHPGLNLQSWNESQGTSGVFSVRVGQPVLNDVSATQISVWNNGATKSASVFVFYNPNGNPVVEQVSGQDFCSVTGSYAYIDPDGITLDVGVQLTFDTSQISGTLYTQYTSTNSVGDRFQVGGPTFTVQ